MDFLITGSLNNSVERFKGLIEVSNPDIVISLGPLNLEKPLILKRTWFFVHGKEKNFEILSKSDGVGFMSRIFKYKGIHFCGLSGVFHPKTVKFTRKEWMKIHKGKFPKKDASFIFQEDILALVATFEKLKIPKVDIFVSNLEPEEDLIKDLMEILKPTYYFYPSSSYKKEKKEGVNLIGLEDINSVKGKYLIHF